MIFLKDWIAEFGRSDVEFASLFGTKKLLDLINIELDKIDLLSEGPITNPDLQYKRKNSEKKELFRVAQKHLVYTSMLQKIIAKTVKSQASEQVKQDQATQLAN